MRFLSKMWAQKSSKAIYIYMDVVLHFVCCIGLALHFMEVCVGVLLADS